MSGENKIPSGWVETILDDVCYKVTDGSHQSPKSFEGGKPMLSVKDMREFGFDFDNCKTISTEDYERLVKQGCKPEINDILIAKDGSVLKHIFRVNKEIEGVLLSSIAIVKPNTELIDPGFLVYLLVNPVFKKYILNNFLSGSGVPRIVLRDFKKIIFFLPSLPEQQAIAAILTTFDDKIELLQAQNETLEATAQTIFKEWFGKYQVGDELPEGWREGIIGELIEIRRGGSPRPIKDYISDTGYKWLKISDATATASPYIFDIKESIRPEGLSKTTLKRKGDLVLSNSATPGLPKILEIDTCIHDGWMHFPQSTVSNEFLYLLFLDIRPRLVQQGSGSVFVNLKTDILRQFPIVIPNQTDFDNFDLLIKPIFDKMKYNAQQIQTLQQTRDILLPKLMSGQLRVDEFKD